MVSPEEADKLKLENYLFDEDPDSGLALWLDIADTYAKKRDEIVEHAWDNYTGRRGIDIK